MRVCINIIRPDFWNKMLKLFNSKDVINIESFQDFYVFGVSVLYLLTVNMFCVMELFCFLTKAIISHRRCSTKKWS